MPIITSSAVVPSKMKSKSRQIEALDCIRRYSHQPIRAGTRPIIAPHLVSARATRALRRRGRGKNRPRLARGRVGFGFSVGGGLLLARAAFARRGCRTRLARLGRLSRFFSFRLRLRFFGLGFRWHLPGFVLRRGVEN